MKRIQDGYETHCASCGTYVKPEIRARGYGQAVIEELKLYETLCVKCYRLARDVESEVADAIYVGGTRKIHD